MNLMIDNVVWKRKSGDKRNMRNPQTQLDAVANIGFVKTRLMNKGEYRVFITTEQLLARRNSGHRVMVQVNLGEILQPDPNASDVARAEAFASINSKRVDMLIIDRSGEAIVAIEVQGSGHYLSKTAFMRDSVKKEALRRAGISLLELLPSMTNQEIEQQVSKSLDGSNKPYPAPAAIVRLNKSVRT